MHLSSHTQHNVDDTASTSAPLSISSPKEPTTQQFFYPPPPATEENAPPSATRGVGRSSSSKRFGARSLHTAISLGDGDGVQKILDSGIRLSVVEDPGPLHLVAQYPEAHHIVPLLIELGADMEQRDEAGNTALHSFVKANMLQAVAILLARGANVNALNHRSETPLHHAAKAEQEDIMILLLSYGADENLKTEQEDIMILLLSYGADENLKDDQGIRPADYKLPTP